jgi:hypothetical protein
MSNIFEVIQNNDAAYDTEGEGYYSIGANCYGYGYSYVIIQNNELNDAAYDTEGEGYYSIGAIVN